ncbi:MAG TPA: RNA polymerase sigma factor [Candidatus Bathyarchaeia archaeon]|nr:RNA polymerase sigma factor [Candidatus Bathyarchaeia archaeon]
MDQRNQVYDGWLVLRCQEGDVAALDELIRRWQERLWRHAWRLTGDREAAWDVLQETMMAISRGIGRLVEPAAFSSWAYRIATNQSRDHLRRKRRQQVSLESYFAEQLNEQRAAPSPIQAIDLHTALEQLPAPQQTLVSLRYQEGFSVSEIAGILAIHEGTVKSRLYVARQQLRALLSND